MGHAALILLLFNAFHSHNLSRYLPLISFSLRDIYVHGTVRVTLSPLLNDLPLVGGVDLALVSDPRVDFDLGGVANVVDVPGLAGIVRWGNFMRMVLKRDMDFSLNGRTVARFREN